MVEAGGVDGFDLGGGKSRAGFGILVDLVRFELRAVWTPVDATGVLKPPCGQELLCFFSYATIILWGGGRALCTFAISSSRWSAVTGVSKIRGMSSGIKCATSWYARIDA